MQELEWDARIYGPRGIGGWLAIVAIGLCISLIIAARQLFTHTIPALLGTEVVRFETFRTYYTYNSEWTIILIFDAVTYGFFLIYIGYLLFEFFQKKPVVPRLMIILYWVNLFVSFIRIYLLVTTVDSIPEEFQASLWSLFSSIAICAIWIPYFTSSRRVENTFAG